MIVLIIAILYIGEEASMRRIAEFQDRGKKNHQMLVVQKDGHDLIVMPGTGILHHPNCQCYQNGGK